MKSPEILLEQNEEIFKRMSQDFDELSKSIEKTNGNHAFLAKSIISNDSIYKLFISSLKFDLTSKQKSSYFEIMNDLKQSSPMNRLLQGDVGCGKTIVATLAALQTIKNGFQVAFMAPTEILAEQHYLNLKANT